MRWVTDFWRSFGGAVSPTELARKSVRVGFEELKTNESGLLHAAHESGVAAGNGEGGLSLRARYFACKPAACVVSAIHLTFLISLCAVLESQARLNSHGVPHSRLTVSAAFPSFLRYVWRHPLLRQKTRKAGLNPTAGNVHQPGVDLRIGAIVLVAACAIYSVPLWQAMIWYAVAAFFLLAFPWVCLDWETRNRAVRAHNLFVYFTIAIVVLLLVVQWGFSHVVNIPPAGDYRDHSCWCGCPRWSWPVLPSRVLSGSGGTIGFRSHDAKKT